MRVALALAVVSLSVASPSEAARASSCPVGFYIAHVSILGTNYGGVADNVNHDGFICLKDLKSGGGIFIDNSTP